MYHEEMANSDNENTSQCEYRAHSSLKTSGEIRGYGLNFVADPANVLDQSATRRITKKTRRS